MPQTKVIAESSGFSVSQLLELFKLDGTAIGLDEIYYFTNGSSCNFQPITFDGIQYTPFPIQVSDMEMDGKGRLPRPKLTVSNIRGFVSTLLLGNGASLDGATVTRTRVHARFIDAVNFPANDQLPPWVTPDPTAHYAEESFVINRKMTENPQVVVWELASPLEAQGAKLPRRQIIANVCIWKYRGPQCGHSGAPVSDVANRSFTGSHYAMTLVSQGTYNEATVYSRGDYVTVFSTLPQFSSIPTVWVCTTNGTVGVTPSATSPKWVADQCSKSCASCKLRYPILPLRTSAFPGASRAGWIS